eukprot:121237_1
MFLHNIYSNKKTVELSSFGFYNFYSNNFIVNIVMYVLIILFNIGMILKMIQINNMKNSDAFTNIDFNENQENKTQMYGSTVSNHSDNNSLLNHWVSTDKTNKCVLYLRTLLYFVILLFTVFLLFIYFLFQSLPENNVFNIKSYTVLKAITTPISLLLAITKAFVIPRFVNNLLDTFKISYSHKNNIIMFLRSIFITIIPFIISMVFISQCGNLWSIYWDNCTENKQRMFDIDGNVWTKSFGYDEDEMFNRHIPAKQIQFKNLLRSKDVCGLSDNINISKCLRTFFDIWIPVLIGSILYMIFTPILIIIYKTIKNKLTNREAYLSVDSQYIREHAYIT